MHTLISFTYFTIYLILTIETFVSPLKLKSPPTGSDLLPSDIGVKKVYRLYCDSFS